MERCCANPLLINIDKSEAVYCLFCKEERVLSYSVKYRFNYILIEIKNLSDHLMRFDHIVVEESEGEIIVYLLVSHNSGKCTDFLHQGKVDCAFLFL